MYIPVRMVRKASARGDAEMIQHQKGREVPELRCPNRAAHSCSRALALLDRKERFLNFAGRGGGERVIWGNDWKAFEGGSG